MIYSSRTGEAIGTLHGESTFAGPIYRFREFVQEPTVWTPRPVLPSLDRIAEIVVVEGRWTADAHAEELLLTLPGFEPVGRAP